MRPPIFAPSLYSPFREAMRRRPGKDSAPTAPVPPIPLIGFGEPMTLPPGGKGRPHADTTVEEVRKLIEETTLTYPEIAARTGTSPASISRWMQAGEWKRPPLAPRSMLSVPTPRATANNQHRRLSRRLLALADRYVRELEETPGVDLDKLGQALDLSRMAKLASMPRTPRRAEAAMLGELMRPIDELCAIGLDLRRAPRAAVQDFLDNRAELPAHQKPPRSRGRGNKRYRTIEQRHRAMLERE